MTSPCLGFKTRRLTADNDTAENVYYYKRDITSPSLIASTAAKISQDVGRPAILINNASVARGKSILDATEKDVRFTFDVNT